VAATGRRDPSGSNPVLPPDAVAAESLSPEGRTLHIGVVVPGFHESEQDPFVPYWAAFVAALARRHRVTVFPLRRPAGTATYTVFGARVVPGPLGDLRRRWTPLLWVEATRRITAVGRADRLDVLHALSAHESGMLAVGSARRLGIPALAHVGAGELVALPEIGYGSGLHRIERSQVAITTRHAQWLTAGSRATERLLRRRRRRVAWAPYGVDTTRFRPNEAPPRERAILCVADFNRVKGHERLLAAFARLAARRPDTRLHLVGGGRRAGELRRLARDLGVAERVRWWGQVPNAGLHVAYAQATAAASASYHEGQGVALVEAAACGLPIAATRVGIVDELPAAGVTSVADAAALDGAMARALDAAGRRGPGAALRQAACADFSLAAAADRFEAVYRAALRSGA
jgi:glycosyltransferase involved in cell wall biosynthesis